jgi:spore maturation protein A
MLNYIWAGLIIISVVFALWQDGGDFANDTYRNGQALTVRIEGLPPDYADQSDGETVDVKVKIDPSTFVSFFGLDPVADNTVVADYFAEPIDANLVTTDSGRELHFAFTDSLPRPLDVIYEQKKDRYDRLPADLDGFQISGQDPTTGTAHVEFGHVGFVKVKHVAGVMFEQADSAVTFAIGLMGVIALWMGLMKIAEDAGLVNLFVKLVRPVLGPLFPQIPRDHPALGLIAVNLAANMLALGNAATPLGIKAMESLQELNKEKDTATDSMVMLLAMNTASVQLLPPVTLIAIMGLAATDLFLPIFLVTLISLAVAIIAAKLLGRMRRFRATDPMRPNNPPDNPTAEKGGAA